MTRERVVVALAALHLALTPAAPGSEITVEWIGNFDIPDLVDPPGVFIDIEVGPDPAGMNITEDLDVGLIIPATWQGDLIITLEHVQSGRFHRLLDRPGNGGSNTYGYSEDNYGDSTTGERFILDDEAANPYDIPFVPRPGIPGVTGTWQPDTDPLSSFDGDSIVGTWRVWFADLGGGDQARVENITLYFKTIPAPAAGLALVLWVIGQAGAGRQRRR